MNRPGEMQQIASPTQHLLVGLLTGVLLSVAPTITRGEATDSTELLNRINDPFRRSPIFEPANHAAGCFR
jgi:hypothetical protein